MSLVLQPQNYFTIVRQIPNHLDTATYYVQAVIRNALTDAIIETVQLTDKGGQRFKKDWVVPADPSGQGFYISIVTSVYTDSGYTTKSQNYGDDESTYLVQDRIIIGRVGGQSGPDTYEIRQMISEQFAAFLQQYKALEAAEDKEEDIEEPEEVEEPARWGEVLTAISDLRTLVVDKKDDDGPILAKLDDVLKSVMDKEVTEPTDIAPLLAKLDDEDESRELNHQELKDTLDGFEEKLLKKIAIFFNGALEKKQFRTELVTRVIQEEPPAPARRQIDLNELSK